MSKADVIIIGLGAMGTATAWQLARRGVSVIGLEQFAVGHDMGSSHGQTRIIREAYYEHPAYVPLVRRAYELWYDLEQRRGAHLLTGCPCLTLGPENGELVQGIRRSAAEHQLPIENLTLAEVSRRFPAFHFSKEDDLVGVLEHHAGFLHVERCVRSMADEALRLGARLYENDPAMSWERSGSSFTIRTPNGHFTADRLVLTAGAWSGALLGLLGQHLRVMRQVVMWFETKDPALFRRDNFPLFITEATGGFFYGIPQIDERGVKVARHYGAPEVTGPQDVHREVTLADEDPLRTFLGRYLPDADGTRHDASVCLYTLTPDRHFLIDKHPGLDGITLATGFSGHGFKFAPVVGEILADLTLTGSTKWPTDLFTVGRL